MANHASALKAHRQSVTRRTRNRSNRSELRTAIKRFQELLADGKTEEAKNSASDLYSMVDKAVRKKVISPNAAARQKSRLTKHLGEALAQPHTAS
jgi:small subunit ribosomal protein S20